MILLIDALDSFTYNQGSCLRDTAKRGSGSTGLPRISRGAASHSLTLLDAGTLVLRDRRDLLKPGGQQ